MSASQLACLHAWIRQGQRRRRIDRRTYGERVGLLAAAEGHHGVGRALQVEVRHLRQVAEHHLRRGGATGIEEAEPT